MTESIFTNGQFEQTGLTNVVIPAVSSNRSTVLSDIMQGAQALTGIVRELEREELKRHKEAEIDETKTLNALKIQAENDYQVTLSEINKSSDLNEKARLITDYAEKWNTAIPQIAGNLSDGKILMLGTYVSTKYNGIMGGIEGKLQLQEQEDDVQFAVDSIKVNWENIQKAEDIAGYKQDLLKAYKGDSKKANAKLANLMVSMSMNAEVDTKEEIDALRTKVSSLGIFNEDTTSQEFNFNRNLSSKHSKVLRKMTNDFKMKTAQYISGLQEGKPTDIETQELLNDVEDIIEMNGSLPSGLSKLYADILIGKDMAKKISGKKKVASLLAKGNVLEAFKEDPSTAKSITNEQLTRELIEVQSPSDFLAVVDEYKTTYNVGKFNPANNTAVKVYVKETYSNRFGDIATKDDANNYIAYGNELKKLGILPIKDLKRLEILKSTNSLGENHMLSYVNGDKSSAKFSEAEIETMAEESAENLIGSSTKYQRPYKLYVKDTLRNAMRYGQHDKDELDDIASNIVNSIEDRMTRVTIGGEGIFGSSFSFLGIGKDIPIPLQDAGINEDQYNSLYDVKGFQYAMPVDYAEPTGKWRLFYENDKGAIMSKVIGLRTFKEDIRKAEIKVLKKFDEEVSELDKDIAKYAEGTQSNHSISDINDSIKTRLKNAGIPEVNTTDEAIQHVQTLINIMETNNTKKINTQGVF